MNCDLADARLADASFDAVIGWHVLEHVRNPRDQLLRLASLLKPGGVLGLRVLTLPARRKGGGSVVALDVPTGTPVVFSSATRRGCCRTAAST